MAPSRILSAHDRVLHASLQCISPVQKQIFVRALRWIKDGALAEDLDNFNVDQWCVNVDIMIEQYDKYLSDLLDRHAPYFVYSPLNSYLYIHWILDFEYIYEYYICGR